LVPVVESLENPVFGVFASLADKLRKEEHRKLLSEPSLASELALCLGPVALGKVSGTTEILRVRV
jgi:hypothetical protein